MWRLSGLMVGMVMAQMLVASAQQQDTKFRDRFGQYDPTAWYIAEYDFSHPHFDTDWRKSQVLFASEDGKTQGLTIKLDTADRKQKDQNNFVGGSIRRHQKTGYGSYDAWFQAAAGEGVITGFFTYTGPAYNTQHDEIDVEILGQKPDHLHVAWFVDGVLENHFIKLGFDATKGIHHYQFEWLEDRIIWSVDDHEVFCAKADQAPLPTHPGFLFANVWAADPSLAAWSGVPTRETHSQAHFKQVGFTPSLQGFDPE